MHINELSKISGIHVETIRSYRMKGLLHPAKLDNGYYDYSLSDYVDLTYIRKLRNFSLSIDDIEGTFNSSIENQIEVLNHKENSKCQADTDPEIPYPKANKTGNDQ